MAHKEDVLEFLKQNPNEWFTGTQIAEKTGAPREHINKYAKQLLKWYDSVERKEVVNCHKGNKYIVLYRYKMEG